MNPFATVLFNVCSAVTVECCVLYPCCVGVFGWLLLCKVEGSSPVSLHLLRGGIWALSMSLSGFGMGTMLANFHIGGIILVLRAVLNMLVRYASPRGHMQLFIPVDYVSIKLVKFVLIHL